MKALFVYAYPAIFEPGSADRARMRAYADAIGELHVLSALPYDHEEQEGSLHLHGVRVPRLLRPRVLAKRAKALIRDFGIEVVSAQDPFEQGLAAMKAVRGTSARLHIQVHTDPLSPWYVRVGSGWPGFRMSFLNHIRHHFLGATLPAAAGVMAVSARVKQSLVVRYGSRIQEPSVIPIVVDIRNPERVQLPAHYFDFVLLAVSRLEPEKRIEDVLAAFARVLERYPDAGLFIAGKGRSRSRLEHLVRLLGIGDSVVFLGERADARGLMQSANAFIQASAYEGYGLTFVEAALARLPMVVTDAGIIGDVFKDEAEVLVAPVGDPAALAARIGRLIEDNQLRRELADRAELAAQAHLAEVGDHPARLAADLARSLS